MNSTPTPLELLAAMAVRRSTITLGVPRSASPGERRFPLTPECAAILASRGIQVLIEAGAAACIHFPDEAYIRAGARVVDRRTAFAADIVLHLPAISADDALLLRQGAMLIGLFHPERQTPAAIATLLRRHVIAIALDLITDAVGNRPFADILAEIDGRAAMALASSMLADPIHGKGILAGGIAGVVPCEVTIIGSGIAAQAAARSAIGLGATVRIFDNDTYRLRSAVNALGAGAVISSAIHPRVFASALRSADIVIATPIDPATRRDDIDPELLKRGVITFDLCGNPAAPAFPGLRRVDLASATAADNDPDAPVRTCYVNAGSAVPRTAAMALSTSLLTLFDQIVNPDTGAVNLPESITCAVYTFMGRPVNQQIADIAGLRAIDINILLNLS